MQQVAPATSEPIEDEPDVTAARPPRPPDPTPVPAPAAVASADPVPAATVTAPVAAPEEESAVEQSVRAAVGGVLYMVRPAALVVVATEFTFPLMLALAVLGYLLAQGFVDRRDPKLRGAPQNVVETLLPFRGEDEL